MSLHFMQARFILGYNLLFFVLQFSCIMMAAKVALGKVLNIFSKVSF